MRSLTIYGRDAIEYPKLKADFEVAKRLANSRSRELDEVRRRSEALAEDNAKMRRLLVIAFDALTDIENDYNDNEFQDGKEITPPHKRCVDRAYAAHNEMREAVENYVDYLFVQPKSPHED